MGMSSAWLSAALRRKPTDFPALYQPQEARTIDGSLLPVLVFIPFDALSQHGSALLLVAIPFPTFLTE
jgi:hypothetical protein